jgi:sporulation protein YlmC with PRC-barrel domain
MTSGENMMKLNFCTGTLVAFAITGLSGSALAQQNCDSEIRQLRTQLQQQPAEQRQQVSQLLDRAEQAGPDTCQQYVAQARQQLQQRQGAQGATVTTGQQSQAGQAQQQQQQQQTSERMDVQVEQAPAEVQVETGAPKVIVRQQPPKVTVEQQPPIVEITQPEAQVNVTQAEPRVRINQAEPEIQVVEAEAEVEVVQAGEPIVRMIGPEGQGQQAAAAQPRQQESTQQQVRGQQQMGQSEASALVGRTVLTDQGEELGQVQSVVRSQSNDELRAVVDIGGFLGIGDRQVAIPVDRGQVTQTGHFRLSLSRQELEQMQEYDPAQYTEVQ